MTGTDRQKDKVLARIYQAIRMEVNDELKTIESGLKQAVDLMVPGARLIVLSYHSLEDRLVKQIFREKEQRQELKIVTRKVIRPEYNEINTNPRARSAKMRAAEKI